MADVAKLAIWSFRNTPSWACVIEFNWLDDNAAICVAVMDRICVVERLDSCGLVSEATCAVDRIRIVPVCIPSRARVLIDASWAVVSDWTWAADREATCAELNPDTSVDVVSPLLAINVDRVEAVTRVTI